MGLYERIAGRDDNGNVVPNRIAPELFAAVLSEFARDQVTGAEALEIMAAMRMPLSADEVDEAQALLATVTSQPTAGAKINRYLEIRDVLFIARLRAPGYELPQDVKTRLGV